MQSDEGKETKGGAETKEGKAAEVVDAGTGRCLPGGGCKIARCRASYARRGGGGSWRGQVVESDAPPRRVGRALVG